MAANYMMTDGGGNWRGSKKGGTSYNTGTKKSQGPNMMDTETPANNSGGSSGKTPTQINREDAQNYQYPSGGSGSSGGGGNGASSSDYNAQIQAQQADAQKQADIANAQMQAAANMQALMAAYDDTYNRSVARIMNGYYSGVNTANSLFNQSMGRVANSYDTTSGVYRNNYNSASGEIGKSYEHSRGEVTTDAERALREAYINSMMNRRDLRQALSAQGLNGGAAESTMASMLNAYGNSRSGIEQTRDTNISNLLRVRDANLASALQYYNNQIADLSNQRMNIENQLDLQRTSMLNNLEMQKASMMNEADNISAQARMQLAMFNAQQMAAANQGVTTVALPDMTGYTMGLASLGQYEPLPDYNVGQFNSNVGAYANQLDSLLNNQNAYTYEQAAATNPYNTVSTQQAVNMSGSDYAKYLAQLEMMAGARSNPTISTGYGTANALSLAQMLAQLGAA